MLHRQFYKGHVTFKQFSSSNFASNGARQTIHRILVFYKNMLQIIVKHAFQPDIVIRNAFKASVHKRNLNREAPMGQNYHQYRINVLEIVYMFTTASTLNTSVTNAQLLHKLAKQVGSGTLFPGLRARLHCPVRYLFWFAINQALGAELGILNCFFT